MLLKLFICSLTRASFRLLLMLSSTVVREKMQVKFVMLELYGDRLCIFQAISVFLTSASEATLRNIKTIAQCLADERFNAGKVSSNIYLIKKNHEIERVLKSNW